MKKVLVIVLCLVFAFGMFAGCGNKGSDNGGTTTPPADNGPRADGLIVPDLSGQDLVIGISTGSTGTSWRDIMVNDLKTVGDELKAAGTIKDYKMVNNVTNGDAAEQVQIIRDFIDDPAVNIIMLNPNDQSALAGPIADAQKAGKLVVVFDASCDAPNTLQVTLDHYQWGLKNAEFVCSTLQKGTMIDIMGLDGHPANVAREQALTDTLAKYPDIKVDLRTSGGWDQTKAKGIVEQYLAGGKTPDAIMTQDGMADGCLSACQDAGVLPKVMFGDPGTAFFKKWKALRDAGADFKACAQPNPPGIGASAMRLAVDLAQGKVFKDGTLKDSVYYYVVSSFYTDENFDEGWALLKDKPDDYLLSEYFTQAQADALFQ